jgi:hypothetical protein
MLRDRPSEFLQTNHGGFPNNKGSTFEAYLIYLRKSKVVHYKLNQFGSILVTGSYLVLDCYCLGEVVILISLMAISRPLLTHGNSSWSLLYPFRISVSTKHCMRLYSLVIGAYALLLVGVKFMSNLLSQPKV